MENYRETSREAWDEIRSEPAYQKVDDMILALLARSDEGLTDDAVELMTGIKHQTISANRRHLVERGLVVDSGRRGQTRSGRAATLWVVRTPVTPLPPDDRLVALSLPL